MLFDFSSETCNELDCGEIEYLIDTESETSVELQDIADANSFFYEIQMTPLYSPEKLEEVRSNEYLL